MTDSMDLQNPSSASTQETTTPAATKAKKTSAPKPKKAAAPARASKKSTEAAAGTSAPKTTRTTKKMVAAPAAETAASSEDGKKSPAPRTAQTASGKAAKAPAAKSATAKTSAAKKTAKPASSPSPATAEAAAPVEAQAPALASETSSQPQSRSRRTSAAKPKAAAPSVATTGSDAVSAAAETSDSSPAKRGRRSGSKSAAEAAATSRGTSTARSTTENAAYGERAAASPEAQATETASADSSSRNRGDTGRSAGRNSSPRGRRGGQRRQQETAADATQEPQTSMERGAEVAPMSAQLDISSPAWDGETDTDDFAGEDRSEQRADGAPAEKKKRSRSRRGRGRKKSTAQEGGALNDEQRLGDEENAFEQDDEVAAPQPENKDRNQGRGRKRKDMESGDSDEEREAAAAKLARRKMFVSVVPEEQVEVVITEEGQVQEYYVEMMHQIKTKGNIYKGVIHNVDPNLQAAFVNYGAVKNGFLQIDEVHPEYYVSPHDGGRGKKYPPIQKVLKPGQEVLVQVVKEPAGTKGAFLTTYLSLPGRFLVLTPGREQIGVSRKVESESERARLRELLEGLNPGAGLGVIIRTVSMGTSKANLQSDLQYLKRSWSEVRTRGTSETAPCLVYQELDLATRAVRDYLNDAVTEVWIDDEKAATSITEMASILFPAKRNLVRVHKEAQPLFERFNVQRQIDQIQSREVALPSGGRLAIDPTEALTAIDINSGRSGGKNNFEDMAYRTNMEAARMIPLQLRLRDIGGQIVADFIEMRDKSHWREVEKALRDGMKTDRARYDVGKIGPFGMLEIVRQRLGSSAISVSTEPCPYCKGTGVRRNMEWQCQKALRDITRLMRAAEGQETTVVYEAEPTLALHLLNSKRQRLLEMEQNFGVHLEVRPKAPEHI